MFRLWLVNHFRHKFSLVIVFMQSVKKVITRITNILDILKRIYIHAESKVLLGYQAIFTVTLSHQTKQRRTIWIVPLSWDTLYFNFFLCGVVSECCPKMIYIYDIILLLVLSKCFKSNKISRRRALSLTQFNFDILFQKIWFNSDWNHREDLYVSCWWYSEQVSSVDIVAWKWRVGQLLKIAVINLALCLIVMMITPVLETHPIMMLMIVIHSLQFIMLNTVTRSLHPHLLPQMVFMVLQVNTSITTTWNCWK